MDIGQAIFYSVLAFLGAFCGLPFLAIGAFVALLWFDDIRADRYRTRKIIADALKKPD